MTKSSLPISIASTTAFPNTKSRSLSSSGKYSTIHSSSASTPTQSHEFSIHTVANPKVASWRVKPPRRQHSLGGNQPLTVAGLPHGNGPPSVAPDTLADVENAAGEDAQWIVTTPATTKPVRKGLEEIDYHRSSHGSDDESKHQTEDSRQREFLLTTKILPSARKSTESNGNAATNFGVRSPFIGGAAQSTDGVDSISASINSGGGGDAEPALYDYDSGVGSNKQLPKNEEDLRNFVFEEDEQLPFLRGADEDLVQLFQEVLHDPDIPSESRRLEEIHLLAVSYLTARQLQAFNSWSTKRRKRVHDYEQQQFDDVKRRRSQQSASATALGAPTLNGGVLPPPPHSRLTPKARTEIRDFVRARLEKYKNDF